MAAETTDWLRVGTVEELQARGVSVVPGADRPIAVFWHEGRFFAVDNRCPHMGFPLHRGSVEDGILTCHWHHARFDLSSGCTFDLFADDVPAFEVEVRGEEVFVGSMPRQGDPVARYSRRLREGLEQNLSLIQAKSILGLQRAGVRPNEIVHQVARFGVDYRDGWGSGMTILTAMANLVPLLSENTAYLALYQGSRRVAQDCAGMPPRRERHALDTDSVPAETLGRWMRQWVTVRHRDGAERTLLTAIRSGMDDAALTDLVFTAATERFYADTGHTLDFCNKAFELLDLIGWEHAAEVLPSVVPGLVTARGGEEMNSWRHPVDLVPLVRAAESELPGLLAARDAAGNAPVEEVRPHVKPSGVGWRAIRRRQRGEPRAAEKGSGEWGGVSTLANEMLGDDPARILNSMQRAFRLGAHPEQVSAALAYAAALRIARFGTANEFGDWITALHTFTYCNALDQAVRRCPTPGVVRGIYHGAMSIYLDRFLNVPPARLPGEREPLEESAEEAAKLREQFLESLDQRGEPDAAARLAAQYLRTYPSPAEPLIDTLARALLREDADFHTFQMVEAAVRQYRQRRGAPGADHFLIAAARYLAAHSPTQRAQNQTAQIALRLHRGDPVYEDQ